MLLEANYRERLLTVYNEVKKRLDYQVALQNLKRQKEQDHMVQWVEKSVIQSITPQQVLVFAVCFNLHYVLVYKFVAAQSFSPESKDARSSGWLANTAVMPSCCCVRAKKPTH